MKYLLVFLFLTVNSLLALEANQSYPLISVNLSGEGYSIIVGGKKKSVNIKFVNEVDELTFTNLRLEIKTAFISTNSSPNIFITGKLKNNSDFIAQSWFLITPFYEINSLSEGYFDLSKTKLRKQLHDTDFNDKWFMPKSEKGKFISETQRPKNIDWSSYLRQFSIVKSKGDK
jgi:hypothetical protein